MINWDAVGAVGEIVGAAGVIITLLYLATQIRQNTRQARATAHQALTETGANVIGMIVSDKEMAQIWYAGLSGELSHSEPSDWTRFQLAFGGWLEAMESIFMQHQLGSVHEELFDSRMEIVRAFLKSPTAKTAWKEIRFTFSKSFVDYVEAELM